MNGAGVAEPGQSSKRDFMRGTQDPVPKGYMGSNPIPCTKTANKIRSFSLMVRISEIYDLFWNRIDEEMALKKKQGVIDTYILLRGSKCTYCRSECEVEDSRTIPIVAGRSMVVALVHNDCMGDFLKSFVEKKNEVDAQTRQILDLFWAEQAIKAVEMKSRFGFSEVTLMFDYGCAHCSKYFEPGDYFGAVTIGAEGHKAAIFVVHKECAGEFFTKMNEKNPLQFCVDDVYKTIRESISDFLQDRPKNEQAIHNAVVALLMTKGLVAYNEQETVAFGQTSFRPDITLRSYSIAIEIKYCKGKQNLRNITNEILSDIVAYRKDYKEILFVVYDQKKIIDTKTFVGDIERYSRGAKVLVVSSKQ